MRLLLNEEESKLLNNFIKENKVFVELSLSKLNRSYELHLRDFNYNFGFEIGIDILIFETDRIKAIEYMLKAARKKLIKNRANQLSESDKLCSYCPCTEFGTEEVNTNQYNLCEGICCKEALENYLEEE